MLCTSVKAHQHWPWISFVLPDATSVCHSSVNFLFPTFPVQFGQWYFTIQAICPYLSLLLPSLSLSLYPFSLSPSSLVLSFTWLHPHQHLFCPLSWLSYKGSLASSMHKLNSRHGAKSSQVDLKLGHTYNKPYVQCVASLICFCFLLGRLCLVPFVDRSLSLHPCSMCICMYVCVCVCMYVCMCCSVCVLVSFSLWFPFPLNLSLHSIHTFVMQESSSQEV